MDVICCWRVMCLHWSMAFFYWLFPDYFFHFNSSFSWRMQLIAFPYFPPNDWWITGYRKVMTLLTNGFPLRASRSVTFASRPPIPNSSTIQCRFNRNWTFGKIYSPLEKMSSRMSFDKTLWSFSLKKKFTNQMIVKRKIIHFRWGPKLFRVVSSLWPA